MGLVPYPAESIFTACFEDSDIESMADAVGGRRYAG